MVHNSDYRKSNMKVVSFITMTLILVGFSLLIPFQAMGQGADEAANPCISSDANLGDSANWANTALELYGQKQYKNAIKIVDACLNQWVSGAITLQQTLSSQNIESPPLAEFTESEKKKVYENYLLNDVSIAIWVKARALDETDEIELAKKMYSNCIFLSHGRAWDPQGWFWSPAADCIKQGRKLLK
ncbi:MAG: hypothetical protein ACI9RV_001131 [Glaciecola sp.]|jgi:hypothetical protein